MNTIDVTLTIEQLDDICFALLMYEIDSSLEGYKDMPEAIHEIRQYLLQYRDECFK